MISLTVNGKQYDVDVSPDTPLLWVIRDAIGLTGTKFGCGLQQCGACTVHLDGVAVRSCGTAVSTVGNKKITTAAGAAAGAYIGRKIQQHIQENQAEKRTETHVEHHCVPAGTPH